MVSKSELAKLRKQVASLKSQKKKRMAVLNKAEKERRELARLKKQLKHLKTNPKIAIFKKKANIAAKKASKKGISFLKALDKQMAKSKF